MLSYGLQNNNGTFSLTSTPLKMLHSNFYLVSFFFEILSLCCLLEFKLYLFHCRLSCCILTSKNMIRCFSVRTLTSKNIRSTCFVLCFFRNIISLPISCISTLICLNHRYLLAVYTLNTTSTHYFFVYHR